MNPNGLTLKILGLLLLLDGCASPNDLHAPPVSPATHPSVIAATMPATTRAALALPTTADPRDTLPFLASDELEGRLPGTPGLVTAGDFLAGELNRIGLQPLPGRTDYFQPFPMGQTSTVGPATQLTVNGKPETAKDYCPMAMSAGGTCGGAVVFAGFGITTDAAEPTAYDDYANIDVHGKVVLAMMKEPITDKGVSRLAAARGPWSSHALFVAKAKTAASHGAVALLLVAPLSSGGPDDVSPYNGDGRRPAAIPVIQITRRLANVILSMGGAGDLKTIQDGIDGDFKPRSSPLKDVEISANVDIQHSQINVRNVMAYLPGTGPHADEWVVIGAHYDHLGRGQMGHMVGGKVGSIWHGADDNASGTAAVIELADHMKKTGPLQRSVLFIFFTAEEEGLIGSEYFVNHPLIPLDKTIAMLNLDMVGRLRSNSLQIGGGGTAKIMDSLAQSALQGTALIAAVPSADDGGRGGVGPSDHASFAGHKIPVLFLFTGLHSDYHRPTDTADKINYAGIDTVVGVAQKIADEMAVMPRQQYDSSSDRNPMTGALTGKGGGHRAVLGVVPGDDAMDATDGVPISGVKEGGPAEKAGLKANDVIVALNGKSVKTLQDLSQMLDEAHGGDKVVVKVLRDSKPVELHAVLDEH